MVPFFSQLAKRSLFQFVEQTLLSLIPNLAALRQPILVCMHDVENQNGYCSVNLDEFDKLKNDFLKFGYELVDLETILVAITEKDTRPMVHFMFDDGCSGWLNLIDKNFVSFAVSTDENIYRSEFNYKEFINLCNSEKLVDHLSYHGNDLYNSECVSRFYNDFESAKLYDRHVVALPFGGEREIVNYLHVLDKKIDYYCTTITNYRLEQLKQVHDRKLQNLVPRVPFYAHDTAKGLIKRASGCSNLLQRAKAWI